VIVWRKDNVFNLIQRVNFLIIFLESVNAVANSYETDIELLVAEERQKFEIVVALESTESCLYLLHIDKYWLSLLSSYQLPNDLSGSHRFLTFVTDQIFIDNILHLLQGSDYIAIK
jgi:hypothetical protein